MQSKSIQLTCPAGLSAADDRDQSHRPRYRARFVQAGRVRAAAGQPGNVEVLAEALQRAVTAGLFDHKGVFVDHAGTWQNPSLERLVGVTGGTTFAGQAVEGEIELYDTPLARAVGSLLDELLEQGEAAPDVGLSIVFYPVWQEASPGSRLRRVVDIREVESVDLVFQPAAGGRVLEALSSAAQGQELSQIHTGDEMMEEQDPTTELEFEADGFTGEPPLEEVPSGENWLEAISRSGAQALLWATDLPLASRLRLSEKTYATPSELYLAILKERKYLGQLQADRVVQIGGNPPRDGYAGNGYAGNGYASNSTITGMRSSIDRLSLALEALIAGVRPPDGIQPLSGIREAYHLLSGDFEMSGVFQPERVSFANVTSSTMAALVANALNKRLANEFQEYPQWWAPIVSVEDFTTLQDVRWITLGGVGELPTVAEGAAYTELSWDDKTETASFVKKGGYLGLTLEAIDKDDTGRLRAAPRALAQAAWLTLSKAISAIFTLNSGTGPTVSDNTALFTSGHANLGTTALSVSSYAAARLAMRKQTELNSGERLGALAAPKYLLVPPDLEITALQVLASEFDYTYALSNAPAAPANALAEGEGFQQRMNLARSRVIVVDLWTDTNDWAAVADPRLYPTIGLGFRYGRTPEIFSVASPTAGLMFTNDTMPVKARFFFAVGPMDWKGLYKSNVA